jgi:hypothetical protein
MAMTKKEFAEYYKKTGEYHDADPENPMNSELTGPSTLTVIIGKTKDKKKKKKMMGGGYAKKAKMAYGGSVKGKKHMYSAGGSVTDNPGLKALRASGAGGIEAYKKITGKND